MPRCKNDLTCIYRGTEFSPKGLGYSAKGEDVGTVMEGRDGKLWVVTASPEGSKHWFQQKPSNNKRKRINSSDEFSSKKTKKEKEKSVDSSEDQPQVSKKPEISDQLVTLDGQSDYDEEEKTYVDDHVLELGQVINLFWIPDPPEEGILSYGGVYQITDYRQGRYYVGSARGFCEEHPCPEGAWFTPLNKSQKQAFF